MNVVSCTTKGFGVAIVQVARLIGSVDRASSNDRPFYPVIVNGRALNFLRATVDCLGDHRHLLISDISLSLDGRPT